MKRKSLAFLGLAISLSFFLGNYIKPQSFSSAQASATSDTDVRSVFVTVAENLIPSVVNIYTTARIGTPWRGQDGGDDLWRRFFEEFFGESLGDGGIPDSDGSGEMPPKTPKRAQKAMSLGSGFIIEVSNTGGLILTNHHVIDGAEEIKIKFTEESNEKDSPAEVIGTDPDLDIALLKVKTRRKLEAVKLGDSGNLKVGEWIAALGNPFGLGHSISHGIVSAKERSLPGGFAKYLQVDAPINPGNSGGPLVNLKSEVVGINNAIDARGNRIGFAIPINNVKNILDQLKNRGKVERGYIGINVDELRPDLAKSLKLDESVRAPIVTNVVHGKPADRAGLRAYDVIVAVEGKPVYNPGDLVSAITAVKIGEETKIKVLREGKEKEFKVKVEARPDFYAAGTAPKKQPPQKVKKPHPHIGMEVETLSEEVASELGLQKASKGVVIARVTPSSPADEAGLVRGDVVLEVDKKQIASEEDFFKALQPRKRYILRIRRQTEPGREVFNVVTLNLTREG